jgi:hypothetical protein
VACLRRFVEARRTAAVALADAAPEDLLADGIDPAEAEVLVIGAILALTRARRLTASVRRTRVT